MVRDAEILNSPLHPFFLVRVRRHVGALGFGVKYVFQEPRSGERANQDTQGATVHEFFSAVQGCAQLCYARSPQYCGAVMRE